MWRGRSGKGVLRIGFGAGGGEAVRKEMPVHGAEPESFWQLQNLFSMPVRYQPTSELGVNHAKTTSSWSKRTFFPHERVRSRWRTSRRQSFSSLRLYLLLQTRRRIRAEAVNVNGVQLR